MSTVLAATSSIRHSIHLLMAAVLLSACAGSGAGLDANGQPLAPGGSTGGPLSADFNSIQADIFTPICTVCHEGAAAPQGLRLDAADSYELLVGVPSTEVPSIPRVKPGDPNGSYLIQKLEGHAAVGARMPFGGPYLSSEEIATIAQWITNGAARGSAVAAAQSMALVARVPDLHDVMTEPPPQILLGFSRDLDATRIDPDSVRLERLRPAGSEIAARVPARIIVAPANPRALLLWPREPLPPGRYRVVTGTQRPLALLDNAGNAPDLSRTDSASAPEGADAVLTTFDVETRP